MSAVRVLVVGDAVAVGDLARSLAADPALAVVAAVASAREVPAATANVEPDVVLLTTSAPTVPRDEIAALREHVAAPIVLLVPVQSPSVLAEADGAGLADLLPLPQTPQAVAFALHKAAYAVRGAKADAPAGRVVTVFSPKGGTGKSVTATNVAAALARSGRSTLLVDLDLQFGDTAIMLGLEPRITLHEITTAPGELDADKLAGYATVHPSGLHVVPAPLRPEDAEKVPDRRVAELVAAARGAYEAVVVDTSPEFHGALLATLDLTDELLVVCSPDVPTLKNVRLALRTLELLSFPEERIRIVLNRAGGDSALSASDVATILGRPLDATLPAEAAVTASVNRGTPVVLAKPNSPFSLAVAQLAEDVAAGRRSEGRRARRFALGRS